jgi:type I restriction-modification system DNA methylase subunit
VKTSTVTTDTLRANSDLKSTEYSTPVLGLIFLKFADNKYRQHEAAITAEFAELTGTRRERPLADIAIEKCGFYLPDHARYDYLLRLPEQEDSAKAIKKAMEAIEEYKPELKGVLSGGSINIDKDISQSIQGQTARCHNRQIRQPRNSSLYKRENLAIEHLDIKFPPGMGEKVLAA